MKSSLLDKVRQVSKQFFQIPKEEKQKCAREREPNNIEGYGNDIIYLEIKGITGLTEYTLKCFLKIRGSSNFGLKTPNDFRYAFLSPPTLNECSFLHEVTS